MLRTGKAGVRSMSGSYQFKSAFQNRLRPLVNWLAAAGVSANQVTIAAVVLSACMGSAIAIWHPFRWVLLFVPIVLFLRMALNAIDGMLAREHGMTTALGTILNELGDVVSDAAIYLPFGFVAGVNGGLLVTVMILSIISEMAGLLGVVTVGNRRYDGWMGKSDRALSFGIISLLLAAGVMPGTWLNIVWIGLIFLLIETIVDRVRNALSEVECDDLGVTSH